MVADDVVKYILEGLAVSVASHLVSRNRLDLKEIALLGITAALVFMVLDQFSPAVSAGARQGSGFGVGHKLVGGGDCGCAGAPVAPAAQDAPVEAFRSRYRR